MILKHILFLSIIMIAMGDDNDDYMDTIVSMLMHGDTIDYENSNEYDDAMDPVLIGDTWKCGDCNNLDEMKLIYSEVNDLDDNMKDDRPVDLQVGLAVENMKCVTVKADDASLVKRISGGCRGDAVTLTVTPSRTFTVNVYS